MTTASFDAGLWELQFVHSQKRNAHEKTKQRRLYHSQEIGMVEEVPSARDEPPTLWELLDCVPEPNAFPREGASFRKNFKGTASEKNLTCQHAQSISKQSKIRKVKESV